MMTLKQLRADAKERGLKGYSTLNRNQLEQLLRGESVLKYRKNQRSIGLQTDFKVCGSCTLTTYLHVLHKKFEKTLKEEKRKNIVITPDGLRMDQTTYDVVGSEVDYGGY